MKTLKLLVLALLSSAALSATTYFYSNSTGYDWKSASPVDKLKYCEHVARGSRAQAITAKVLCDSLDEFYATTDDTRLRQSLNDSAVMIAQSYVNPALNDPKLSWVERQKLLAELQSRGGNDDPSGTKNVSEGKASAPGVGAIKSADLKRAFAAKPGYFAASTEKK